MANYFENLRPASYRGISFEIPDDNSDFGRRVETHEYPGRDQPYHEDLGQSSQGFNIQAVIIGDDFIDRANALEEAFKKEGPGRLIHPHYGELEVIFKSARRYHNIQHVGEVIFSVNFEKYGAPIYPVSTQDTASKLNSSSIDALSIIQSEFIDHFNALPIPDFVPLDANERALDFSDQVRSIMRNNNVFRLFEEEWPETWDATDSEELATQATNLFQNIADVTKPVTTPVIGNSKQKNASSTQIRGIIDSLSSASSYRVIDETIAETSTQSIRQSNAQGLDFLFRASSIAAAVQATRYATYESREDAILVRDDISEKLSLLRDDLGAAGWDQSWQQTGTLMAVLSRDINERIGRLPRTIKIKTAAVRSSLALSNRLYGDDLSSIFDGAEDISTRNNLRHPGFVPVEPLEVLIDAA